VEQPTGNDINNSLDILSKSQNTIIPSFLSGFWLEMYILKRQRQENYCRIDTRYTVATAKREISDKSVCIRFTCIGRGAATNAFLCYFIYSVSWFDLDLARCWKCCWTSRSYNIYPEIIHLWTQFINKTKLSSKSESMNLWPLKTDLLGNMDKLLVSTSVSKWHST